MSVVQETQCKARFQQVKSTEGSRARMIGSLIERRRSNH